MKAVTTGFDGEELKTMVNYLKGAGLTYEKQLSMGTTVLVAKKALSDKWDLARKRRIPIVRKEWTQPLTGRTTGCGGGCRIDQIDQFAAAAMFGLTVSSTTFVEPQRSHIHSLCERNGATASTQLTKDSDLLIVPDRDLAVSNPKLTFAAKRGIRVMKVSELAGKLEVPLSLLLDGGQGKAPGLGHQGPTSSSALSRLSTGGAGGGIVSMSPAVPPARVQGIGLLDGLPSAQTRSVLAMSLGDVHCYCTPPHAVTPEVRRMLHEAGVKRVPLVTSTTTHVVVIGTSFESIKLQDPEQPLNYVSLDWLRECALKQQYVSPARFQATRPAPPVVTLSSVPPQKRESVAEWVEELDGAVNAQLVLGSNNQTDKNGVQGSRSTTHLVIDFSSLEQMAKTRVVQQSPKLAAVMERYLATKKHDECHVVSLKWVEASYSEGRWVDATPHSFPLHRLADLFRPQHASSLGGAAVPPTATPAPSGMFRHGQVPQPLVHSNHHQEGQQKQPLGPRVSTQMLVMDEMISKLEAETDGDAAPPAVRVASPRAGAARTFGPFVPPAPMAGAAPPPTLTGISAAVANDNALASKGGSPLMQPPPPPFPGTGLLNIGATLSPRAATGAPSGSLSGMFGSLSGAVGLSRVNSEENIPPTPTDGDPAIEVTAVGPTVGSKRPRLQPGDDSQAIGYEPLHAGINPPQPGSKAAELVPSSMFASSAPPTGTSGMVLGNHGLASSNFLGGNLPGVAPTKRHVPKATTPHKPPPSLSQEEARQMAAPAPGPRPSTTVTTSAKFLFPAPLLDEFSGLVEKLGQGARLVRVADECTHYIVANPGKTATMLGCIAGGKWILTTDYVTESVKAGRWLSEAGYEWAAEKLSNEAERGTMGTLVTGCRLQRLNKGNRFLSWRPILCCQSAGRGNLFSKVLRSGGCHQYHVMESKGLSQDSWALDTSSISFEPTHILCDEELCKPHWLETIRQFVLLLKKRSAHPIREGEGAPTTVVNSRNIQYPPASASFSGQENYFAQPRSGSRSAASTGGTGGSPYASPLTFVEGVCILKMDYLVHALCSPTAEATISAYSAFRSKAGIQGAATTTGNYPSGTKVAQATK